ncbi:hypothetical protein GAR05_04655 [Micromonospora saelicesensis]|uniref:DUF4240 domain-containing protein n=1 Tax=Micromonospora saelicesensis TaxID=285676 RepID=A0ABX9CEQ8_9ACTN|nr:hypothetical protein GAR05_04655 [Micromonospora saelicesensis]RAO59927.1 hypothetical protein PSN01_02528 [Micromonospora saelicesensis]
MGDADWWSILRALDEPIAPVQGGIGRESILRAMVEGVVPEPTLAALDEGVARGDGDGLEVPRDFDHAAVQGRFDRLTERLNHAYGCPCDSGLAQDSACFGRIWIPAEASRSRTKRTRIPLSLTVHVSKFGGLATYGASSPGGHNPYLHPDDRQRIEQELTGLGYLIVPEQILATPYDGPNAWVFGPTGNETWATRFFDQL